MRPVRKTSVCLSFIACMFFKLHENPSCVKPMVCQASSNGPLAGRFLAPEVRGSMPAPCGGLGVFVGRAIRLWWGTGSAAPGLRSVSDTNPSATAAVGAVLAGGGGWFDRGLRGGGCGCWARTPAGGARAVPQESLCSWSVEEWLCEAMWMLDGAFAQSRMLRIATGFCFMPMF